ncbi:SDR family NAD(P)-dependent oxidoreductase [Herbaspirillum autotrophicum]|uniref:SDR family NAD(P)-dependent oxidoreductase n=1 Tax=Herbaspirillum autotrophicum TaxID=180195 RepID=UPI00067BA6DE|nr:SDR family NAD(P)-dependent oxidoreductase [Herbaspirillum autotrophicum]
MEKVALISGASRGIGLAVAHELLARGYRLSLGVRNPALLAPVFPERARVLLLPYEARDLNSPKAWVAATLAAFGRIDVVVNSAGICKHVGLEEGTEELLEETLDINVKAPYRLLQAAFAALKVSGEGRVINLASLSGKRVRNLNIGYQMSKHAAVALNHGVRRAGWEHGIRATAICPGYVNTELATAITDMPPAEMTSAADLASLIATTIALPNTASVAELLVNCAYENLM